MPPLPTLRDLRQLPTQLPQTANHVARETERVVKTVVDGAWAQVDAFVGQATRTLDGLQRHLPYLEIPVPQQFEEHFRRLPFIGRSKAPQSVLGKTDQQTVDRIYDLLEYVDQKLGAAGVPYFIASGTLLGAHRHGGLIPWDDDADLCVPEEQASKIWSMRAALAAEGYELTRDFFGFKISKKEFGGHPFVDLFLLRKSNEYASAKARLTWPKDKFPYSAFDQPEATKFGHLTLPGPKREDAVAALRSSYGDSWANSACKGMTHDGGLRSMLGLTGSAVLVELTDLRPALHSRHRGVAP